MQVTSCAIADVLLIEPKVFGDDRGFFYESYNQRAFHEASGLTVDFVQDNHSKSARNVLRGLHYQINQPQGKLVKGFEVIRSKKRFALGLASRHANQSGLMKIKLTRNYFSLRRLTHSLESQTLIGPTRD